MGGDKMKTTITITWWPNEGAYHVPENAVQTLESDAMEQITNQMHEWYIGGELHTEVNGEQYNGMWELTRTV